MSVLSAVFGASVSVNSTELSKNATNLDNSTKSLNGSEIPLKIREADLVKLNTSESMNSTRNSTHRLNDTMLETRASGDEEFVLDLGNSSMAGNFSKLNDTLKTVNVSTRAVNTSMSNSNATHNATANPWAVLPLFRDLNSTLHNSSLRNSSESVNATKSLRSADSAENSIEKDDSADKELSGLDSNGTRSDSMEGAMEDDGQDDGSTKKPCTTVSCLISRGCSDESCSQNDN